MKAIYDVKDMLCEELEQIVKKGELSAGSLDTVDKLLHSIKNADKIIMYDEYSAGGYSYGDADMDMTDYSTARGRGSDARRDSRGRYSSARGRMYSRTGYSYHDDKAARVAMLQDLMSEVNTDEDRRVIQKMIRRLEQE